jgi:hypothetical protein
MPNYRACIGGVLTSIAFLAGACNAALSMPSGLLTPTPLPIVEEQAIRYVQQGGV